MDITLSTADSLGELQQILELQAKNHFSVVGPDKSVSDGFVTVRHTPALLEKMNEACRHIIAKDGNRVVGYALVMLQQFQEFIPELKPMFALLDQLYFKEKPLTSYTYYVMGQICIDEHYRGKGLFDQLYAKHKERYAGPFDLCVTEVATRNTRSMKAHYRVGFQPIHTFKDEWDEWRIVVWDWGI